MSDLLKAQEELTKDLHRVDANEVPELLNLINEIRLEFDRKNYTKRLLYIAALIHDIQNEEHCVCHETMSNFFNDQQSIIELLR